MSTWIRCACACAMACVLVLFEDAAHAHDAALTSQVYIDVDGSDIGLEMHVPIDQLALAMPHAFEANVPSLPRDEPVVRDYLGDHVRVSAGSGSPMRLDVGSIALEKIDGADYLAARLVAHASAAADLRELDLFDDAILHRVVTHRILIYVRKDVRRALLGDAPKLAGVGMFARKTIAIDRKDASTWRGLRARIALFGANDARGQSAWLSMAFASLAAVVIFGWRRAYSSRRTAGRRTDPLRPRADRCSLPPPLR